MSEHHEPISGEPGGPEATSTGLDPKIASLLAYAFGWISGLIIYLVEKQHREVRFHAAQSVLVSLALTVAFIALSILMLIPVVNLLVLLVQVLLGLAAFALWIYMMIQGYNLRHVKLPVVGDMAEEWAAKTPA